MDDRVAAVVPPGASAALRCMVGAALLAGDGLLAATRRGPALSIAQKTAGDFVSAADLAAEQVIFDHLMAQYPDYGWLGEETGARAGRAEGLRWVVDPLDGTTNFLKGLPHWAVSIALCQGDAPLAAVIHDPPKGETFCAEMGAGAWLNGSAIAVSAERDLSVALLASGVPSGGRTRYLPHCLDDLAQLMPQTAGLRRWGAASLDLAYVAAGRYDAYWERNLGAWDIAAGMLMVCEAGGRFTPLWPERPALHSGSFLASNGPLHDAVEAKLNRNSA